jgi:hypothetical protein
MWHEHRALIEQVCESLPCDIVTVPNAGCLGIRTPSRSAIVRFALLVAAENGDLGRAMAESVVVLMPPEWRARPGSTLLDQPPIYLFGALKTNEQ